MEFLDSLLTQENSSYPPLHPNTTCMKGKLGQLKTGTSFTGGTNWKKQCYWPKQCLLLSEPMGSMSSMEVNVDALEQMDLMDLSDQEALDVFLNSGGEDNTVISPGLGKSNDHTKVTSSTNPFSHR